MRNRYNITLDEDIYRELEAASRELGEKKSAIIEKALTAYFDLLDLKLAKKRLKDLQKGKDKTVDADKVWEIIGF